MGFIIRYSFVVIALFFLAISLKTEHTQVDGDVILNNVQESLPLKIYSMKLKSFKINEMDFSIKDNKLYSNTHVSMRKDDNLYMVDLQHEIILHSLDRGIFFEVVNVASINSSLAPIVDKGKKTGIFNKAKNFITEVVSGPSVDKIPVLINKTFSRKPIYEFVGDTLVEQLFFDSGEISIEDNHITYTTTLKTGILWTIFSLMIIFFATARETGLLAITLYQKYISPRKNYRCAKSVLHDCDTCSTSVKKVFEEKGFIAGMQEYFKTTEECSVAYETLKKQPVKKPSKSDGSGSVLLDVPAEVASSGCSNMTMFKAAAVEEGTIGAGAEVTSQVAEGCSVIEVDGCAIDGCGSGADGCGAC